ncbi:MAG: RsmB/NOP family class I SAM-dependent RNA methyltransferase [Candidatus Dojkabacteria bacterium]|nr:MAG: RsmB/NOP family class I SAM-dependent RNA methyltransferase [Candidatus Dojkabacteria bacterium]
MGKKKDFAAIEAKKWSQLIERVAAIFAISEEEARQLLSQTEKKSLRINTLVANEPEIVAQIKEKGIGLQPIHWMESAYHSPFLSNLDEELAQGKVYIQNASSFLPVLALNPQKGEKILDICSSPGGKLSHIAAVVNNEAELWANDLSVARISKLQRVLSLLKVKTERVTAFPAQRIDQFVNELFDKILLDAPCSGEGMMTLNDSETIKVWGTKRIKRLAFQQKKMITAAFRLLRKGGTLVYSTCTFGPEENEEVIAHLLEQFSDAEIQPFPIDMIPEVVPGLTSWRKKKFPQELALTKRVKPTSNMEGFYVAIIRRK